jgi:hypothetical protein
MQKLYDDSRIKLFFLSPVPSKANAFLIKEKRPYLSIWDKSPLELESSTIPASYLIDKYGNIVVTKIGTADWNSDSFRKAWTNYLNNK